MTRSIKLHSFTATCAAGLIALCCEGPTAAYHLWVDERGQPDSDRVYKNPPLACGAGDKDYFKTRKLDRNKGEGAVVARELLARAGPLIEACVAQEEREAQREKQARRDAVERRGFEQSAPELVLQALGFTETAQRALEMAAAGPQGSSGQGDTQSAIRAALLELQALRAAIQDALPTAMAATLASAQDDAEAAHQASGTQSCRI